jgi:class 3 adenylate cyclase
MVQLSMPAPLKPYANFLKSLSLGVLEFYIAMQPFFLRVPIFLLSVLWLSLSAAESNPCVIHIDSITETVVLDSCWKYHAGDDSQWAEPAFDDSGWDTLSTRLNLIAQGDDFFAGVGWFRLHVVIDSSLRNKTYALLMTQQGASEVYLNGKLIHKFGVFGLTEDAEEVRDPKLIPGLITFGDSLEYLLAVRYSNHKARHNLKVYREANAGFEMSLRDHTVAMRGLHTQVVATYLILFLFMVFLVLGIVHFLLFLFYRKQKSNLYYSIFMLLFSGLIYVVFQSNNVSENPDLSNRAGFVMSLLFPLFFIPMSGFIYSLFMEKIPRIFYITIGIAVVMSTLYLMNVSFISPLYIAFVLLLWLEVTRVVIRAMIRKIDGAWIIGIGVLFFILFFTVVMVYVIRYGNLVMSGQSIFAMIFAFSVLLAILSIPFSMSVYLARDFARTNVNLEKQLEQVKILSAKTLEQEREKKRILEGQKEKLEVLVKERTKELAAEKEKTEELLLNTLPLKVVNELKENGKSEPESFEDVTVYFSDIVGFTSISSKLEPKVLIRELNEIFTAFDDLMEKHSCERIKTIGDAYLAVSGMPERNEKHAYNMVRAALEIRHFLEKRNKKSGIQWTVRIGIHSGKVVGGIVGVKKYIYDVFGDTINTTSRMESNSKPMQINVSETTYNLLKDQFTFMPREPMDIKGKGEMRMYFLKG